MRPRCEPIARVSLRFEKDSSLSLARSLASLTRTSLSFALTTSTKLEAPTARKAAAAVPARPTDAECPCIEG